MLLLHLRFDGFANVLDDHSLYLVWARCPRLALAAKKVFHLKIMLGSWPQ
jgi:hypothetical protein